MRVWFLISELPILMAMILLIGCASVPMNQIKTDNIRRIKSVAVLPFTDAPGADAGNSGRVVAGAIGASALNVSGWRLIDQGHLQKLVGKVNLSRTSSDDLMRIGHNLGVDAVIVGNVSQYEIGSIPFLFFFVFDKNVYRVSYSMRMIDVRSGEVCWAGSATGTSLKSLEDSALLATRELFANIKQIDFPDAIESKYMYAQQSTKKNLPKHSVPPPASVPGIKSRWAVIIGVSDYQDSRIPSLRYASADAKAFYIWAISPNGGKYSPSRTKLLLDQQVTGIAIKEALFNWLGQALEEDVVTIYFAGHGSPQSPDYPENLFLLPFDCQYDKISSTGFPMWDIETALKRYIKAKKVVVIADACHSGGVGQAFDIARRANRGLKVNPISSGIQSLTTVGDGICVISASDEKQYSQESKDWGGGHGVFTYFLLKGLKGDADYNKDASVNLGELTSYVSQEVRRATKNAQSPTVAGRYDPALTIGK